MKINRTALAAAASVVAVVVAGTAALAANFGILSGGEQEVTTPRVLSTLSDEHFVDVPDEQLTNTTGIGETLAYQVEGVGVVTLERTGDSLATVSVDVDSQWVHTELPAGQGVAIKFESSSQVIAFSATVVDGQVIVDVVDETPVPSAGTYDDDDSHGGQGSDDGDHSDDDSHGGSESDDDDSYEDD